MRTPRPPSHHGFTLPEILVVVVILGTVLLLVPPNLHVFGARSRLENFANTVASAVSLTREQAILDGYPVYLEFSQRGYRFRFTNLPARRSDLLDEESGSADARQRPEERTWMTTMWEPLPEGIEFVGRSEEENDWDPLREEEPYSVAFLPDGTIEKGFAIRLRSEDLDVKEADRTLTILINGLTTEARVVDGEVEMPPTRDENEFGK